MAKIDRTQMTQTDSKGKVLREPKKDPLELGKFNWWKATDDTEMAMEIAATLKFMQRHQSQRNEQLAVSTRLYGNSTAFGFLGGSFTRASSSTPGPQTQRLTFNLCSSIIDTLVSKIAKNEVTPSFITSGGSWGMQKKAEQLSKFAEGFFYHNHVHEMISEAVGDCGVWGDGLVYVYRGDDDKVGIERVVPQELFVDMIETIVGKPRQMHRVKTGDRDVFLEMFADDEKAQEAIKSAMPATSKDLGGVGSAADLLTLSESWHLPSGPKAKDGLRAICVEDKCIYKEKYDKDYFPFPHLRYIKRKFGHWGQGACERLQNLQGEINRNMIVIQKSLWMQAGPKIYLPIGSKIATQHINNEIAGIITGNEPPSYLVPPCVQPEVYQWIETLIQKGYQQEGVSQMAAANVKPMGIDSGEALRTYDEISDDRQLHLEKKVEAFALEILRQAIEVVRDIHADTGHYKVQWPGTNFIETIDWNDIRLAKDEYWLRAFPTSSLPDEPASKLQTVQEYAQAGFISPRSARRLLRMPDVEMSDALANASEELICRAIEDRIYDGDDSLKVDGAWDLQLAKTVALEYYNFAMLNNCPEDLMQLLRDFQNDVDGLLGLTNPMPTAGPMAPNQQPLAQPMATPTSNLIPNIAGAGNGPV